jgi:RNA polymerase sigma factor (TIGR02999 family)
MASSAGETVPDLLTTICEGDRDAAARLVPLVYDELRALARRRMAGQGEQTLQPTALVHEAYLKLVGDERRDWDGKTHFYAAAAQAMRHILVDTARRKGRIKRGGGAPWRRVDLDIIADESEGGSVDLVELDDALHCLAREAGARKTEVVVLRYFAGFTIEQIATTLGVTTRTVDRDWRLARAWLFDHMTKERSDVGESSGRE